QLVQGTSAPGRMDYDPPSDLGLRDGVIQLTRTCWFLALIWWHIAHSIMPSPTSPRAIPPTRSCHNDCPEEHDHRPAQGVPCRRLRGRRPQGSPQAGAL